MKEYVSPLLLIGTDIPQQIHLNKNVGFFIGLFLAQGQIKHECVIIENIYDITVHTRIHQLFKVWNVKYQIQKNKIMTSSHDLLLFVRKLTETEFPFFCYKTSEEFLIGFLDGYLSSQNGKITETH